MFNLMPGEGPFLWLSKTGPPAGFWQTPKGGMCISAFLFVTRGGKVLLGKYGDDPRWEELTGLDPDRRREHGKGWTLPASQLRFGEDPRDAARRIAEQVLRIPGMHFSEPRVEVDLYPPESAPGEMHYDIWFLVDAAAPEGLEVQAPPWYAELAWHDPRSVPATSFSRGHEDVVERWLRRP
jgi:ADP-ribose pyrophosphatase YjhB (NUDIX family)